MPRAREPRDDPRLLARVGGWLWQRLRSVFGFGPTVRQGLIALVLNSSTSLVAGAFLGAITGTFTAFPGLLVMVPAAIGLRGNIFSTFGNRLSTAIHTGTFELSMRRGSLLRQNVEASMILTAVVSVILALLAKLIALGVGVPNTSPTLSLITISVLGGLLASLVVLLASLLLAAGAVRYGWDLDNVVAPIVSTLGDVLTLPALWLATFAADTRVVTPTVGIVVLVISAALFLYGLRAHGTVLRQVTRQSWPVLSAAALLSTLAGIVLQQRLSTFTVLPALLMLQPAFVSSAGALGGILSSRLSSKLHLGLVPPALLPDAEIRADAGLVMGLAAPVYLFNAVGAHFVAVALHKSSPGLTLMIGASMIGGIIAVLFALVVAYYGTIAAVQLRLDPDTYGIPIVTSSVDFAGVVALIAGVGVLGITR